MEYTRVCECLVHLPRGALQKPHGEHLLSTKVVSGTPEARQEGDPAKVFEASKQRDARK